MTKKPNMTAKINWIEDFKFTATSGSGHSIVIHPGDGGTAPSPIELMVMGLGGCASIDIVHLMEKNGQKLTKLETHVDAERPDTGIGPRVLTTAQVVFHVHGDIDEDILKQAVDDAYNIYCSASTMLKNGGVDVTFTYHLNQ